MWLPVSLPGVHCVLHLLTCPSNCGIIRLFYTVYFRALRWNVLQIVLLANTVGLVKLCLLPQPVALYGNYKLPECFIIVIIIVDKLLVKFVWPCVRELLNRYMSPVFISKKGGIYFNPKRLYSVTD